MSTNMWKVVLVCLAWKLYVFQAADPGSLADLSTDYFAYKRVPYTCYFTCQLNSDHNKIMKSFMGKGIRISSRFVQEYNSDALNKILGQWNRGVGVLVDTSCDRYPGLLLQASRLKLYDEAHMWLVVDSGAANHTLETTIQQLNLSVDADIVIATDLGGGSYHLTDIFNYGKIQGNPLERTGIGSWSSDQGLNITSNTFKYYDRWNFNNLTLRAVTVILERPKEFKPEILFDVGFSAGVAVMTKITSQLLFVLKEQHNFRFNFTIASRWIGSPEDNSTLAVTNSLNWGQQDISCTCARIYPKWLEWVDVFLPPITKLETKFYYLILDKGVGNYENRFLTPLSNGVWWCIIAASIICALLLVAAALLENRSEPASFGFFSVFAVICQQAFEDSTILFEQTIISSEGKRFVLMLVGIMSMMLYNYYTSSVVSWLLNAAAPTLVDLNALITSDLEVVFEDIGYTRGWLEDAGSFYFSGFTNPTEDKLREKKVYKAKRTAKLLQPVETGIELIRTGDYAYHTEPYTAYQYISKTFKDRELCELGSLQIIPPSHVYIMAQKRSPYKQYFVWSLLRLSERGHAAVARARSSGWRPACSGRTPRALALGQAAPAFAVLAVATLVTLVILIVEILWHRYSTRTEAIKRLIGARMTFRRGSGPGIITQRA